MRDSREVMKRDWTVNRKTGRSNSSPTFERLCGEVDILIRSGAASIISGDSFSVARLIMAQLAHKHGLNPNTKPIRSRVAAQGEPK